jgi:hypothetical protein
MLYHRENYTLQGKLMFFDEFSRDKWQDSKLAETNFSFLY